MCAKLNEEEEERRRDSQFQFQQNKLREKNVKVKEAFDSETEMDSISSDVRSMAHESTSQS